METITYFFHRKASKRFFSDNENLRDARPMGSVRDTSPPPPLAPLKVVTFDEKVEKLTCYYRLNEEQISYAEHERKARERGATVASICSAEENEAVVRVARGQFCFVGALRIGGGNGPTSANWKWADGKPFQYTNWSRDEPNNYTGHEDRVMIMVGRRAAINLPPAAEPWPGRHRRDA